MKKLVVKIIGILVILILLLNNMVVLAVSRTDLKNQKNSKSQEINQAKEQLQEIQTEKSDTLQQVEDISTKITDYQNQIQELDNKISELTGKITEAEENIKSAEEEYKKTEDLLNKRLVATYEAGETSYLDVILSSKNISDLISNYYLVTQIATYDNELMDSIEKQKKEIEDSKKELENNKNELDTSKTSKESITKQLEVTKKEKNEHVQELSEDEQATQAKIEQLQADNEIISQQLAVAEKQYQAQLEALRKKQQEQGSNSSGGSSGSPGGSFTSGGAGVLQRPVKSGSITTTMYYSSGSYHGAIDYGVPVGTTVYAAADGVVYQATSMSGSYGNYVVIQHTNGLRTWYAHGNGVFYVSAGQTVSKGQPIMQSGNSGNSSGPHLHFEVRVAPYNWSNNRVDPRNYM